MTYLETLDIITLRKLVSRAVESPEEKKRIIAAGKAECIAALAVRGIDEDKAKAMIASFPPPRERRHGPEQPENETEKEHTETETEKEGNNMEKENINAAETLENLRALLGGGKAEIDENRVRELIAAEFENLKSGLVRPVEIHVPEMPPVKLGTVHRDTPRIIQYLTCGLHVMLTGPAGSGKTTACEKAAEALGLKFYPLSVGPQTTKSDLLGYCDAAGNYHRTPVREAFENGGLLLLDEMDAANAGVLTCINSLLANGICCFPDKVITKHADFRCICACNTFGRGADRQYVGRNQLDAATLDRFARLPFDYDEQFELAIAGNDAWTRKVQQYRHNAEALKMRVVISPRASIAGAKLLAAGVPENEVENAVIFAGLPEDQVNKIRYGA